MRARRSVVCYLTVLAAAVVAAGTAIADPATVDTDTQKPYGPYLVDANGMSLYLFEADEQGGKSTCHDRCAQAWPPLLADSEPQAKGQAQQSLLGTIERNDGSRQVTYNGWPLYHFVKDQKPGDIKGQDVKGFGAEWYLVAPRGEHVEHAH